MSANHSNLKLIMKEYTKQPLTYQQQISLLKSRGVHFTDETQAENHLANISYYRLSAYMIPYKEKVGDLIINQFKIDTSWDKIYQLYVFDRKLRLLIFDAIERIEIAVRTQLIYQLSHKYGSHWQDNKQIFKEPIKKNSRKGYHIVSDVYSDIQKHIKEQLRNKKAEIFIQHYHNEYDYPENPPSWMSVEIMYFNHLSRICSELRKRSDIEGIASYFSLPSHTFCSWLHTLNYIRNICAHHARLWNRTLKIVPEKLSFSQRLVWINNPHTVKRSKIYYSCCMINYLLQTANPGSAFKQKLIKLMNDHKEIISLNNMGFPHNWLEEKVWTV